MLLTGEGVITGGAGAGEAEATTTTATTTGAGSPGPRPRSNDAFDACGMVRLDESVYGARIMHVYSQARAHVHVYVTHLKPTHD
jgi:hypothetical protein